MLHSKAGRVESESMTDQQSRIIGVVLFWAIVPPLWVWLRHKIADDEYGKGHMIYAVFKRLGHLVASLQRVRQRPQ